MIAYKQSHVFEEIKELETTLIGSATVFVELVERIAKLILEQGSFSNLPKDTTANFSACLHKFLRDFNAWKIPDEAKLTRRIWHALNALEDAQIYLPEDEAQDSRLWVEFRTQTTRLRDKLRQIAGAAKVREFDASRRTARAEVQQLGTLSRGRDMLPQRMSNEQLAHELMLDNAFQLNDSAEMAGSGCPLHRAILERFHQVYDVVFPRLNLSISELLLLQAFYTSLVSDLTLDPPCYLRVVRLLREVRDGISDVATGRIAQEINETIDLELIDQRISSRAFTWADCRNLITGVVLIIRRMQKPARDASLKAGWDELRTAMEATNVFDALHLVASLKFLLERVNFLRVDAANARYVCFVYFPLWLNDSLTGFSPACA